MKIKILCIGKTTDSKIKSLYEEYLKRISHYGKVSVEYLVTKKKFGNTKQQKQEEGELILSKISPGATLILLDELGKSYSSNDFANFLQKKMNIASREIVFVVGGAYGFSDHLYLRANAKIALSKMTFTHQMVRLIFIEQLYRAFTILKGEKYHH